MLNQLHLHLIYRFIYTTCKVFLQFIVKKKSRHTFQPSGRNTYVYSRNLRNWEILIFGIFPRNYFLLIKYKEPKMTSFFVRITYPYADITELVEKQFAPNCERVAVYEHELDTNKSTHCHLALINCSKSKKQLVNYAINTLVSFKGNKDYSWKKMDESLSLLFEQERGPLDYEEVSIRTRMRPFVYMAKGKYEPSFLKSFTTTHDSDKWRAMWVDNEEALSPQQQHFKLCFEYFSPLPFYDWFDLMRCMKRKELLANTDPERLDEVMADLCNETKAKSQYYAIIQKHVDKYVWEVYKGWTPAACGLQKYLTLSYCFQNKVTIYGRLSGFVTF